MIGTALNSLTPSLILASDPLPVRSTLRFEQVEANSPGIEEATRGSEVTRAEPGGREARGVFKYQCSDHWSHAHTHTRLNRFEIRCLPSMSDSFTGGTTLEWFISDGKQRGGGGGGPSHVQPLQPRCHVFHSHRPHIFCQFIQIALSTTERKVHMRPSLVLCCHPVATIITAVAVDALLTQVQQGSSSSKHSTIEIYALHDQRG